MTSLILALAKILGGLFLSSILAFGFYLFSIPIIASVWRPEALSGLTVILVSTSSGATLGAYIAWFDRDRKFALHALIVVVAFAGAIIGAKMGIQEGIVLDPLKAPWEYGLPILSLTIRGAVIGANIPALLVWTVESLRGSLLLKRG